MYDDLLEALSLTEAYNRIEQLRTQVGNLREDLARKESECGREFERATRYSIELARVRRNFFVRVTDSIYRGIRNSECTLTRLKWYANFTHKYRCVDCQKFKFSTKQRQIADYYPTHRIKQCADCAQLAETELGFRYLTR
jgi:hypothetical protein